jgi:hypothetical protein
MLLLFSLAAVLPDSDWMPILPHCHPAKREIFCEKLE